MSACPFCKGRGVVTHAYGKSGDDPLEVTLSCNSCSGTGDYEMMRLYRAFRLGQQHEHAAVMARLTGSDVPPPIGAEAIKRAVIDDDSRLRMEDQLREMPRA